MLYYSGHSSRNECDREWQTHVPCKGADDTEFDEKSGCVISHSEAIQAQRLDDLSLKSWQIRRANEDCQLDNKLQQVEPVKLRILVLYHAQIWHSSGHIDCIRTYNTVGRP